MTVTTERACKFQVDQTGTSVLVYDETRSFMFQANNPDHVARIRVALNLGPLQKAYAMASVDAHGQLMIGARIAEADW